LTEPQVIATCAHCGKPITKDQPITATTDTNRKAVAVHGGCHRAFQEAKG